MRGRSAKLLRARARQASLVRTAGLTLDTGVLIQLARRKRAMWARLEAALAADLDIRIPAAVVAEFWRGDHGRAVTAPIEGAAVPDCLPEAQAAGTALAAGGQRRQGPSVVDAIVAAVAFNHGDVVLSSDPADFQTLAQHFRSLRVISV